MGIQSYVVMGAGEVGFHLARSLSRSGHNVTVIECSRSLCGRLSDELDVAVVCGNGAHVPVLEAAGIDGCDLFLATSSSDEANLAASLLAKRLGARRSVVRLGAASDLIGMRHVYSEAFEADLLLSTQLLTTSRIVNAVRGLETTAVEHLAAGKVQLRKVALHESAPLVERPLAQMELPRGSLIVAFFRGDQLIVPGGEDRARPGDQALVLGATEVISAAERAISGGTERLGRVVIGGGGGTALAIADAIASLDGEVQIIERDPGRAAELASIRPAVHVLLGDVTDPSLLRAERVGDADCFVAVTGHDEANLMACLLAQEHGVEKVIALVDRTETSDLWQRIGAIRVFSPRALAHESIREYIARGFTANIVSLHEGAVEVVERRLFEASPAAGVTLAEIAPPRGLIVGAVVRGSKVFVPRGADRLEVGDLVILFVREEELTTVQLLFPGRNVPA